MAQYKFPRQKMDFSSKYMHLSAFFMGVSFFCRCLYYYGMQDISTFGTGQVFLSLTMPLVICGIYIAMTAVIHINIPLIYGSLGALVCLMALIWNVAAGDLLRIILGFLCYGGTAGLMVCIILGLFRDNRLVVTFVGLVIVLRVLFFDLSISGIANWIRELADLSTIISICFLPLTIQKVKKEKKVNTSE